MKMKKSDLPAFGGLAIMVSVFCALVAYANYSDLSAFSSAYTVARVMPAVQGWGLFSTLFLIAGVVLIAVGLIQNTIIESHNIQVSEEEE